MTTRQIRLSNSNQLPIATISATSTATGFSTADLHEAHRSIYWSPKGNFTIDSTNNSVYINDGSDKTVTLTSADYAGPDAMATHVQTQLNASSSGWTVSWSATTRKFTIANSGSVTLRLSQTTNAAWSTLGFTGSSDDSGTSFVADASRNHTHERLVFDLLAATECDLFALFGPAGSAFSLSSSATVKLQANSADSWASPPIDITLTRSDQGIARYLTDQASRTYRYWSLYFEDKTNTVGPTGFQFGYAYLGGYTTISSSNIAQGVAKNIADPSIEFVSDNGARWFDERPTYESWRGLSIFGMSDADHLTLKQFVETVGLHTPFVASLDPLLNISTNQMDLTRLCYLESEPQFPHVIRDLWSMNLDLREQIA